MEASPRRRLRRYVEHAREAAAIRRWKAAGEEIDGSHRLVEESGEQPAEVKRVVDGIAVEEDEILVRFSTADVVAAGEIIARVHSRHELHRAQYIGLTQ